MSSSATVPTTESLRFAALFPAAALSGAPLSHPFELRLVERAHRTVRQLRFPRRRGWPFPPSSPSQTGINGPCYV
jgi:hypothetical protein